MKIKIVASDSMGVRSLFTVISTGDYKIVIDPGIALSPKRFGLPPHVKELDRFKSLREELFREVEDVSFIFISHFHHDHFVPFYLKDYVVSGFKFAEKVYTEKKIFLKSPYDFMNYNQKERGKKLIKEFKKRKIDFSILEEERCEILSLFETLYHGGEKNRGSIGVMGFNFGDVKFLYLSDSQFLDERVLDILKKFMPDIVLSSGPPIYLSNLGEDLKNFSKEIILKSLNFCNTLILDHHLVRSRDYHNFLSELNSSKVITASKFMGFKDDPLEMKRKENFLGI